MEVGNETDALTREDSLTKLHLVHAIVDHHLKVVDLDDLIPHVGEHRDHKTAKIVEEGKWSISFTLDRSQLSEKVQLPDTEV